MATPAHVQSITQFKDLYNQYNALLVKHEDAVLRHKKEVDRLRYELEQEAGKSKRIQAEAKNEVTILAHQNDELTKELEDARRLEQQLGAEVDALRYSVKQLQLDIDRKEDALQALKVEKDAELLQRASQIKGQQQQIEDLKARLDSKGDVDRTVRQQHEIHSLRERYNVLKREYDQLAEDRSVKTLRGRELVRSNTEQGMRVGQLEAELARHEEREKALQQHLQEAKNEQETLHNKVLALQERVAAEQEKASKVERDWHFAKVAMQTRVNEVEREMDAKLQTARQKERELQHQLTTLEEDKCELERARAGEEARLKEAMRRLTNDAAERMAELEGQLRKAYTEVKRIGEEKDRRIKALKETMEEQRGEVEAVKRERLEAEAQRNELQEQLRKLDKNDEWTKRDMETLLQERQQMSGRMARLQALEGQRVELEAENKRLKLQVEYQRQEVAEKVKEKEAIAAECRSVVGTLQETFERERDTMRRNLAKSKHQVKNLLKALAEAHTREQGAQSKAKRLKEQLEVQSRNFTLRAAASAITDAPPATSAAEEGPLLPDPLEQLLKGKQQTEELQARIAEVARQQAEQQCEIRREVIQAT